MRWLYGVVVGVALIGCGGSHHGDVTDAPRPPNCTLTCAPRAPTCPGYHLAPPQVIQGTGYSAALGDLDGDGCDEIIAVGSDRLVTLNGHCSRTFASVDTTVPNTLVFGAIDYDRDGVADLLSIEGPLQDLVERPGGGDGTFGDAIRVASGWASKIQIDDLDLDGTPEALIAAQPPGTRGQLDVLHTFDDVISSYPLQQPACSFAVGDIDGDVFPDLVRGCSHWMDGMAPEGGTASVISGAAGGAFDLSVERQLSLAPAVVALGDFDGDCKPDLAATTEVATLVALGDCTGTFGSPIATFAGETLLATADVDGDGRTDLVTASADQMTVRRASGAGTFEVAQQIAADSSDGWNAYFSDLDHDGVLDLVTSHGGSSGEVRIYFGSCP